MAFSLDIGDPSFHDNPRPHYARGRREAPLYRHGPLPLVSVFKHDEVSQVLKDVQNFSVKFRGPRPADHDPEDDSMLGQDPPKHTRLRALVNQAFTPRRVGALESHIRDIARTLVRDAVEKREVDIIDALTHPLPTVVIAEMIGVPTEDREQFRQWSNVVAENLGEGMLGEGIDPERLKRREKADGEMREYFMRLADEKRKRPADDLLSALLDAQIEGSALTPNELHAMLVLLLVAGNETTTNLIGNTILALDANPDARRAVLDDASRAAGAVEETLRYDSPVQATARTAKTDLELRGEKIEEGTLVITWLGSANHDEDHFAEPDRFDIERKPKTQIMSFGFGAHYCLGANLARLEARIAIEELSKAVKDFGRSSAGEIERTQGFILRGPTRLPIEIDPR